MTPRQRDALDTIKSFKEKFGYPPSMRELVAAMNLKSTSEAHRLIKGLEQRGYLRRLRNRSRAMEIVETPSLPKDLSQFSISDLAREAKRRGLVVGQILTEIHHGAGGKPLERRKFKEIQPEEG